LTEETEEFLKHYDLDNCSDILIFQEWIWRVWLDLTYKKISPKLSPEQRDKIQKVFRVGM
jgi:hypothetical protein